jgi:hypothetical protein
VRSSSSVGQPRVPFHGSNHHPSLRLGSEQEGLPRRPNVAPRVVHSDVCSEAKAVRMSACGKYAIIDLLWERLHQNIFWLSSTFLYCGAYGNCDPFVFGVETTGEGGAFTQ